MRNKLIQFALLTLMVLSFSKEAYCYTQEQAQRFAKQQGCVFSAASVFPENIDGKLKAFANVYAHSAKPGDIYGALLCVQPRELYPNSASVRTGCMVGNIDLSNSDNFEPYFSRFFFRAENSFFESARGCTKEAVSNLLNRKGRATQDLPILPVWEGYLWITASFNAQVPSTSGMSVVVLTDDFGIYPTLSAGNEKSVTVIDKAKTGIISRLKNLFGQ